LREVKDHVQKSLFRDVMAKLYGRLRSTRKRALAHRQCAILDRLLDRATPVEHLELLKMTREDHAGLKAPGRAFIRDLNGLANLGAIVISAENDGLMVSVRLEWATEITETDFYREINKLPAAKSRLMVSP
jgi:hypothetical protein